MTPEKPQKSPSHDLFRNRLDNMLNHRHELYRLADLIDWSVFDSEFGVLYCPDNGCPAKATRLMVGLQYLKHVHAMSDEAVVRRWVENPYWQYFCGATYFEHQLPIDPSSMTRFRKRIGESGCELILQATVAAGLKSKTIGGEFSNRFQAVESFSSPAGEVVSPARCGVASKLRTQRAASIIQGQSLWPCPAVSAHAFSSEEVTHLSGPGGA